MNIIKAVMRCATAYQIRFGDPHIQWKKPVKIMLRLGIYGGRPGAASPFRFSAW